MSDYWRPGETRFLGLPRRRARVAALVLALVALAAVGLVILFFDAIVAVLGVVAFMLLLGGLTASWVIPWAQLPWAWDVGRRRPRDH